MRRPSSVFLDLFAAVVLVFGVASAVHADTIIDPTLDPSLSASTTVDPNAAYVAPSVDDINVGDDPLHGYCGLSYATSTCSDNGTITPVSGTLGSFGFVADPAPLQANHYLIDVLVPTNLFTGMTQSQISAQQFAIDAAAYASTPNKVDVLSSYVGLWSAGDLATFMGLNANKTSPANPFSAFATGIDSSATGFYVYKVDLGTNTLLNQSGSVAGAVPTLNFDTSLTACAADGGAGQCTALKAGMEITAFMQGQNSTVATAPSSVLQLQGGGGCTSNCGGGGPTPEPSTWMLALTGLAALGFVRQRRLLGFGK